MPISCQYCLDKYITKSFYPDDEQDLMAHIESEHNIIQIRHGESELEARVRFYKTYPLARDPKTCKCPACEIKRSFQNGKTA